VWYQLKAMGHAPELVHLMQGSLQDWIDQGGPIDESPTTVFRTDDLDLSKEAKYVAKDAHNIVDFNEILKMVEASSSKSSGQSISSSVLVDGRDPQRFKGWADEIRPNLKRGHAPGAKNVFFLDLLDPQTLELKPVDELKAILDKAGVDVETDQRIVASCGSGVTACTIIAALELCGRDPANTWLYDGSWTEYGANYLDVPIETEPEPATTT
jgi:thiosulfate/3-mercaptopyruvate sulfurtransferase